MKRINPAVLLAGFGLLLTCAIARGNPRDLQWRYSGTTNNLHAVATSGQSFVAVGNGGTILTSTDTITWTFGSSGTGADLYGVAYGNGVYVAVGGSTNATILTSSNGVTWAPQTTTTTNNLKAVTSGGGVFVAVGDQGTILVSSNGVTWTKRPTGLSKTLRGVTYASGGISNPLFITVGDGGSVFTSPDGLAWTVQSSGVLLDLYCVAATQDYAGGGEHSYIAAGAEGIAIWSGGNGTTWTAFAIPSDQDIYAAAGVGAMGNGAVAVDGLAGASGAFLSSDDAISWTAQNSGTTASLRGLTTCNGEFIAVGDGGFIGCGRAFLYRNSGVTTNLNSVAWGNGKFVAAGSAGTLAYSVDGNIWSETNAGTHDYYSVCFGANRFVAVGDRLQVAVSMDGVNWTTNVLQAPPDALLLHGLMQLTSVAYGDGAFIAAGFYPTTSGSPPFVALVFVSTNGTDWQSLGGLPQGVNGYSLGAGAGPNVFLLSGTSLFSSTDGNTWTARVAGSYYPMVFTGTEFLALGGSTVVTSMDATNWSLVTVNGTAPTAGLCFGNGDFLSVGVAGGIRCFSESTDGTNWVAGVFSSASAPNAVAYGNGSYVVVGAGGLIMHSAPDRVPAVLQISPGNQAVNLTINSAPGQSIRLQTSTDLINWTGGTSMVPSSAATQLTLFPTSNIPEFFRTIGP